MLHCTLSAGSVVVGRSILSHFLGIGRMLERPMTREHGYGDFNFSQAPVEPVDKANPRTLAPKAEESAFAFQSVSEGAT